MRCRISGLIRDAEGSPCCGPYPRCNIWRTEKEAIWKNRRTRVASKMLSAGTGEWT